MSSDLSKLVKKYIENQQRYEEAAKIIEKRKKLREEIKARFIEQDIKTFKLDQDGYIATLEYKSSVTQRVDTKNLPTEIKQRYSKPITSLYEKLVVYRRPSS
jgi:hypothetical protein